MPRGHGRRRTCRHCDMVAEYRDERYRQELACEESRDERARPEVTFRRWLIHYPWPALQRAAA